MPRKSSKPRDVASPAGKRAPAPAARAAGDLSAQIEKWLAAKAPAERKNLQITLRKYELGKTSQWEEKKLRDAGMPTEAQSSESKARGQADTDICDTHEEIAKRMMLHFQNADKTSKLRITVTKKTISDWANGKRLGQAPWPPKPLAGARRRWSLRTWLDWFNEHLWHEYRRAGTGLGDSTTGPGQKMPLPELEEITKRERLEHERWEIVKEMGGYISVPLAERHAAGFSRQYHERWKLRNEKTIIDAFELKALELGVPPAIVAILKEWLLREHQKFTDAVEGASEKFAGELADKLKAEMAA